MEVRPFGVRVVLVEPGDFATGFTDRRRTVAASADGPYRERFTRALAAIERDERSAASPDAVGRLIADLVSHPAPRLRYTVGPALQRVTPALKAILPGGVFAWLIADHYAAR
jgi:NAD(P)-dependent dehydrogenase (short-subunit alcohol dehydrogenase family)